MTSSSFVHLQPCYIGASLSEKSTFCCWPGCCAGSTFDFSTGVGEVAQANVGGGDDNGGGTKPACRSQHIELAVGTAVGVPLAVGLLVLASFLLWRERRRGVGAERGFAEVQAQPAEPAQRTEPAQRAEPAGRNEDGEGRVEELSGETRWELHGSGGVLEM